MVDNYVSACVNQTQGHRIESTFNNYSSMKQVADGCTHSSVPIHNASYHITTRAATLRYVTAPASYVSPKEQLTIEPQRG